MKVLRIFRRIILVFFVVLSCFLFASVDDAYAASAPTGSGFTGTLEMVGAQVRTTGNVGLRFVAKAENITPNQESEVVKAYGIAIGFGINNETILGADGMFNGKNVVSAEVTELDENNNYYVTIFNIPSSAYMQYFTARPYVRYEDKSVDYGENVVVRSLGQVCYNFKNDPEVKDADIVKTVTKYIEDNNKKNIHLQQDNVNYYFERLEDAFAMASNGDDISVNGEYVVPSNYNTITVKKNVTLSFDSKEILVPSNVTLFNVTDGGQLTIKNGIFNGNGSLSKFDKTVLSENELAITSNDDTYRNNTNLFVVNGKSDLNFENCAFENFICLSKDYSKSSTIVKAIGAGNGDNKCNVVFTNCVASNNIGGTGTIVDGQLTRLTLNNSTINGNYSVRNNNHGLFKMDNQSKAYFNGSTFTNNVYNGNGGLIGLISGTELTIDSNCLFENNIGGGFTGELFGELVNNGRFGLIYVHSTSMVNVDGIFKNNEICSHRLSTDRYNDLGKITSQDVVDKVAANGGNIRLVGLIDVHGYAYHTDVQCAVTLNGGAFTDNYYVYADGVKYKTAISVDNDIVNMSSFSYNDLTSNKWINKTVDVGAYVGSLITFPDLIESYKVTTNN